MIKLICRRGHVKTKNKERSRCLTCHAEQQTKARLEKLYGITFEAYNDLFIKQEGCCKICHRHQSVLKNRLCVDHDHMTGKIRGLLCGNCNAALGLFADRLNHLQSAVAYLIGTSK